MTTPSNSDLFSILDLNLLNDIPQQPTFHAPNGTTQSLNSYELFNAISKATSTDLINACNATYMVH
ncbi:hypothetical protein H2248_012542 [Termitomyces sp. 'cryptogamus']|nr:hypothetical protein H2248_012542 [Termitomyces sp. 'cryptogamus']